MELINTDEVIGHRFSTGRKGYETAEVDAYVRYLADRIARLQAEVQRHEAEGQSAVDLLRNAQRVADEVTVTATQDADAVRLRAEQGLEQAKATARSWIDAALAEADQTRAVAASDSDAVLTTARREAEQILAAARADADTALEEARREAARVESEAAASARHLDALKDELTRFVIDTASDLRSGGDHLHEMADRFQLEVTARREAVDAAPAEVVDVRDTPTV